MSVSLAVRPNRQGNYAFPWLLRPAAKKMVCFLGCFSCPPRKQSISLAASLSRQENGVSLTFLISCQVNFSICKLDKQQSLIVLGLFYIT